jgi:nucleoside triphosphate pyrophosphatase
MPQPHSMLILASTSPRRQELLRNAGIPFEVKAPRVPEMRNDGEPPEEYVVRLAREKAEDAMHQLTGDQSVILGADTTVVVDDEILEKPCNPADAVRMLHLLSGRSHAVMTGVCLLVRDSNASNRFTAIENTNVLFRKLSEEEIQDYVATGEPMDKAGAYAIQGRASRWIPRIEGCYFNVVGLPVPLVYRLLQEHAPWLVNQG